MADNRPIVYLEDGVPIYRASGLGSCIRALVAARRGVLPDQTFGQRAVTVMGEGNLHEGAVLDKLAESGWTIDHEQDLVEYHTAQCIVRGHIDALGVYEGSPDERVVIEVKTMSEAVFRKWLRQRWESQPGYALQLSIYMHNYGLPGLLVAKNRNTGEIDLWPVPVAPVSEAAIQRRIQTIEHENLVELQLPPCEPGNTWKCNYKSLHDGYDPDAVQITGQPEDPQGFNALIAAYKRAKGQADDARHEAEELLQEIAEQMVGVDELSTDAWTVERKEIPQKRLDTRKVRDYLRKHTGVADFEIESVNVNYIVKGK